VSKRVLVLDYGSGNLRSAQRALERVGAQVTVSADPGAARDAAGLVVPGVGAFAACMAGLRAVQGPELIRGWVAAGRPLLGICVGMQVLFDNGIEHGVDSAGLGVLAGRVERLHAAVLPHMGWNTVVAAPGSQLFAGLDADARFYFVHSYAALEFAGADGAATYAEHGGPFVAAVEAGTVSATQFHPEKSGDVGATLLENWLASV
jgi:glutamine amidotransferase